MSDHLQLQLRDLGDQISKIVSHHSLLQGAVEEGALGRTRQADELSGDASGNGAQDEAVSRGGAVERDIAEVEKMLQQWLVANGKDT